MNPMESLLQLMIDVPDALALINKVCENALASGAHKPGDWREQGAVENYSHLRGHMMSYSRGELNEDHLANLACRVLFQLQLRIEEERKIA